MSEPSILKQATEKFIERAEQIKLGGGERGIERQHRHGRLTARERIALLIDKGSAQFECGLFIADGMYTELWRRSIGWRCNNHRPSRREALHDYCKRRNRKGWRVFPYDLQKNNSGSIDCRKCSATTSVPRRFCWCFSSSSRRRVSRHG